MCSWFFLWILVLLLSVLGFCILVEFFGFVYLCEVVWWREKNREIECSESGENETY